MKNETVGSRIKDVRKAGGDLISRSALMEAMAGISLDTETDVRAWIMAELLIEEAPSVPDRTGRFVRCDECSYCARSKEGIFWCRSTGGLSGDLQPEKGDGCSRGRSHGCGTRGYSDDHGGTGNGQ